MTTLNLNQRAAKVAASAAELAGVTLHQSPLARILDCTRGGLDAGVALARASLADLAHVSLVPCHLAGLPGPMVAVRSDDALAACLACQYAGWQIKGEGYFAMGSGPMRAAAAKEPIFAEGFLPTEEPAVAVGTLETGQAPPEPVLEQLRSQLPPSVNDLSLMFAPAASIAGTLQVVARSLETALHKLHELKFDMTSVRCGYGEAPFPQVAKDELKAIGWTNDAILYAGRVTIWVECDDDHLAELGPKVPSSASDDFGAPFAELFARYGDFYKIDPLLFSPAEVTFHNLRSGRTHVFGATAVDVLRKSLGL